MRLHTSILALVAAASAWSGQALAQRGFTPEFSSGATRPRTIALLPVDATIVRERVAQTEGLVDESVKYGAVFNEHVQLRMAAKGYEAVIVAPEQINADPMLQEYVVDANRAYDEMMKGYRPKRLQKRIYNAGDSVRLLADHLGVDAVAFSRMNVSITRAGKVIVAALVGGSTSGTSAMLSIVDGTTGDLEAVMWGVAVVTPGEKSDEELHGYVVKVAENTIDRLPEADPDARVQVATGDEDVLSEVESLLTK